MCRVDKRQLQSKRQAICGRLEDSASGLPLYPAWTIYYSSDMLVLNDKHISNELPFSYLIYTVVSWNSDNILTLSPITSSNSSWYQPCNSGKKISDACARSARALYRLNPCLYPLTTHRAYRPYVCDHDPLDPSNRYLPYCCP